MDNVGVFLASFNMSANERRNLRRRTIDKYALPCYTEEWRNALSNMASFILKDIRSRKMGHSYTCKKTTNGRYDMPTQSTTEMPHILPKIGQRTGWFQPRIQEVGTPRLPNGHCNPRIIVPVRYRDGKYGLVTYEGKKLRRFEVPTEEAQRLIEQSTKMPTIAHGIGTDVWHIRVGEGDKEVLIKSYYNYKMDRGAEIYR